MKLELSRKFVKNTQMSSFMRVYPVGAVFFHADRRTVMTKLVVAFRNFAKAPKNCKYFALELYRANTKTLLDFK